MATPPTVETRRVPLSQIRPDPTQSRSTFDPDEIDRLADSLRERGLIQPICVKDTGQGIFEIIAGERRYKAAVKLGRETEREGWSAREMERRVNFLLGKETAATSLQSSHHPKGAEGNGGELDKDPLADFWPGLLANPQIAPQGTWGVEFRDDGWQFRVRRARWSLRWAASPGSTWETKARSKDAAGSSRRPGRSTRKPR